MKKLLMILFIFLMSIFSYADKPADEIMNDLREKDQVKMRQQEEVKKQKQAEQAKIEKEAEKLMEKKRWELTSEPLVAKFGRAENKGEATKKAMEVAKNRMAFENEEDKERFAGFYNESNIGFEQISSEREKILEERAKLQKQLRDLDELERKVRN